MDLLQLNCWIYHGLPCIYHRFTMHLPCIYHGFSYENAGCSMVFPMFPQPGCLGPGLEEHRRVTDGEVRRGDLDGGPALTAAVRQTVQVEGLKDLEMWPHMAPWRMDGSW